jgi:AcrR family transcriptional regulator
MASGGRSSLTERAGRAGHDAGSNGVTPLYKRLPHGPHRLARDEVVLHQRARIHGAMVEAVAECGYESTSVKQVIGLAGVSRRSFYEQFANKQESFLATFDLLVHRGARQARRAYLSADGGLEDRLWAAFEKLSDTASEEIKAAILVLVEAQTAGVAGTLRLCRATATCEQMLSKSFLESPDAIPLPTPIVRGIAGGLHGIVSHVVRQAAVADPGQLAEEMLRWTMLFQTPAAAEMAERMAPRLTRRMREISLANTRAAGDGDLAIVDDRQQVLHTILRLAATHEYRELTAPQIADESDVSIDTFLEHFSDKDACYLEAFDMVGDELLSIAADPELISSDWPHAVRRTLDALMSHLAERPLYARTIAQEAFFAGTAAVERDLELAHGIATLLTEGAPSEAGSALALEGIAGALWHTMRCQVANGRIQLLGALSDYLSYIVLTPFIGAREALEIVTEDTPPGVDS